MERVSAVLANEFSKDDTLDVHIIKLVKGETAFELKEEVTLHEPHFSYEKEKPGIRNLKSGFFLRKSLNTIKPLAVLAMGDRFNAFTLLFGMGHNIFVSNRMNPYLSNGKVLDILNKLTYPMASGIVAQTEIARKVFLKTYRNKNIEVIGNPIPSFSSNEGQQPRTNHILNVGRFSDEKNQESLMDYFDELAPQDWEVNFIGDGPKYDRALRHYETVKHPDKMHMLGASSSVADYYLSNSIFAFTSLTEGFPNALAEAMSAGMACISFDCIAGPADLIDDGVNGFLIKVGDHEGYKEKLQLLMKDPELRRSFGEKAVVKMKNFAVGNIANQYLSFLGIYK